MSYSTNNIYTTGGTYIPDPLSDTDTITIGAVGSSDTMTTGGLYWGNLNGTSGQVLTTTGLGASTWATVSANPDLHGNTLSVKGNAEFDGDIKIKGKSLGDSLERIEERLAILRPNDELEEKWENLRALRNAYKELEAEIIEKEAMWSILKK